MDYVSFFLNSFSQLFVVTSDTANYWAPVVFGVIFWKIWVHYVQTEFISKIKWVMLEIRLPKEVSKPPQAMEMVLAVLEQSGSGSKIEQYWTGRVPLWFSLEIVSIEGALHFFIRTPSKFRDLLESRIYSQYPEVEISEAPDYTDFISFSKKGEVALFGTDVVLSKADPYPIKTYVDYEMHKGFVDEAQRFDPMTPMLEFLGSVGKGEQIWIQILVKAHKKRFKKADGTLGDWRDEARVEIKKLTEGEKKDLKEGEKPQPPHLSKTQNDNIASIERNMSKVGLDCGIRIVYLADVKKFNPGQIASLFNSFKQFSSSDLNGFKPDRDTSLNYPWDKLDEAMGSPRIGRKKETLFDAYRRRSYFYPPYERKPFVLSTEELATIYRFPSAIAETPTLKRLESKKSEPPANLPI